MDRFDDLHWLLSDEADSHLEEIAEAARAVTVRRFGREVQLYCPLYISNECANVCTYCGFSARNDFPRTTLSVKQVRTEAATLADWGMRQVLLVAGEHPRAIGIDYITECVEATHAIVPSVSVEIAPLDVDGYSRLTEAGADGLVIYQETYDRDAYAELHPAGIKRDFDYRMETPVRGAAAGMRNIGMGILLGLTGDWKSDLASLVDHVRRVRKVAWRSHLSVSLPRMCPAPGTIKPRALLSDREFTRALCALRLVLPDTGIVLSTREPAYLRDGLIRLMVTRVSAGSRTDPGGYNEPDLDHGAQFEIHDTRTPAEMAEAIRLSGRDPVWKDWEGVLHGSVHG